VVRIVVDHKKRLPQQGLPLAVRERSKQVVLRIANQRNHRRQIGPEFPYGLIPEFRGIGGVVRGPIAVRPLRGFVSGVARKLQDVPLRGPQVEDLLPRGMREVGNAFPDRLLRETLYRLIETHVRALAAQRIDQLFAQLRFVHGTASFTVTSMP